MSAPEKASAQPPTGTATGPGTAAQVPVQVYDTRRQRWVQDDRELLRRRSRLVRAQRAAIMSVAAVLVASSAGFTVWRAVERHKEEVAAERAAASASASAKAERSREAKASASASALAKDQALANPSDSDISANPPSGYERYEDEQGWTADVPKGWKREAQQRDGHPSVVTYENKDGSRRLMIFGVEESDPLSSVQLADSYLAGKEDGKGAKDYRRLGTGELPGTDPDDGYGAAAYLEYTYTDSDSGAARRTLDERFQAADGYLYAVTATGPSSGKGAPEAKMVKTVLASFCPRGTTCTPA
ncbi:hypothetical protein ACYBSK_33350 [Streptomyces sp. BYX5S]